METHFQGSIQKTHPSSPNLHAYETKTILLSAKQELLGRIIATFVTYKKMTKYGR